MCENGRCCFCMTFRSACIASSIFLLVLFLVQACMIPSMLEKKLVLILGITDLLLILAMWLVLALGVHLNRSAFLAVWIYFSPVPALVIVLTTFYVSKNIYKNTNEWSSLLEVRGIKVVALPLVQLLVFIFCSISACKFYEELSGGSLMRSREGLHGRHRRSSDTPLGIPVSESFSGISIRSVSPRNSVDNATPRNTVNSGTPRSSVNSATPRNSVDNATPRNSVDNATPRNTVDNATPRSSVNSATPVGSIRRASNSSGNRAPPGS